MTVRYARMSRQELYDQVWSEAVTKVAARYELSDVGLRKVCTKHRVPVPPRGYWAKVEAGQKVRKITLPKVRDEAEIVIRIIPRLEETDAMLAMFEPAITAERAFPPLAVSPVLERPHAVTRALQKALMGKPHEYGVVRSLAPDAFLVRASPDSVDRVLRIADVLLKACVERGFELRPGKAEARYGGQLAIVVDGFAFEISFNERMRQELYRPKPQHSAERRRLEFLLAPKYQYAPSGQLTLKLEPVWGSGLQGNWSDSRTRKVEERLGEVMLGMRKLAIWRAVERIRERERQARFEAEQQRRAELRARVEAEKQAIKRLEEDAAAWRRAEAVRAFAAARAAAGDPDNDADLREWLAWAGDQADRIDPLRPNPPSVLDTLEAELHPVSIWNFSRE
jgi:cell division protein FtsB